VDVVEDLADLPFLLATGAVRVASRSSCWFILLAELNSFFQFARGAAWHYRCSLLASE